MGCAAPRLGAPGGGGAGVAWLQMLCLLVGVVGGAVLGDVWPGAACIRAGTAMHACKASE